MSKFNDTPLEFKAVSVILILAAALAFITMLFHPSGYSTGQTAVSNSVLELSKHVHGLMIVYGLVLSACVTYFFSQRECCKALNSFVLIFYLVGSMAMIGAALINGFIFPENAMDQGAAHGAEIEAYRVIMQTSWNTNQILANFAALTWSVSIVLGSVSLIYGTRLERSSGIICAVMGSLVVLALMTRFITLDVSGMTTVVASQSIWYCAIAICLLWGSDRKHL